MHQNNRNISLKHTLLRYGLLGFISCLIGFMIIMSLHIPHSIIFSSESPGRIAIGLGEFLDIAPVALFVLSFISFGILFCGILAQPRTSHTQSFVKSLLPQFVCIAFCGAGTFTIILMVSLITLFIQLFLQKNNPVFASLGYFLGGLLFFIIAILFDWFRILRKRNIISPETPGEPEETIAANRSLSKADKTTAYGLTLLIAAILHGREIPGLIDSLRQQDNIMNTIPSGDVLLLTLSIFLIMLSSFSIMKSLKIVRVKKYQALQ